MSSLRDPFEAIVSGISFAQPLLLPMDGIRVIAHTGIGEEFREDVFRLYSETLGRMANPGNPLSDRAVAHLHCVFDKFVSKGRTAILPDGWMAVNGLGTVQVGGESEADDLEQRTLNSTVNLFGKLLDVSFNDYPLFDGEPRDFEDVEYLDIAEEDVPIIVEEGTVVVLSETVICSAEGYGQPREAFDYAMVPLADPGLAIHGAFLTD